MSCSGFQTDLFQADVLQIDLFQKEIFQTISDSVFRDLGRGNSQLVEELGRILLERKS